MYKFPIIEKFISIDGEGPMAGALATFIRFEGCNLRCKWCDTTYSWEAGEEKELLSAQEIYKYIKETGIQHVTLTGGEPLMQKEIGTLLSLLAKDEKLLVHIETNGSIPIKPFKKAYGEENIRYIVDYKLSGSGMQEKMVLENLDAVTKKDVYKFVVASKKDLEQAYSIIKSYNLDTRCKVYFSPVTDQIHPQEIVEFMKTKKLGKVKLQLQMHKIIWSKESRGV